jgi:protein tyrosine phosphatase (PTP) superfamily phosphohydrolase (DUF442 family)
MRSRRPIRPALSVPVSWLLLISIVGLAGGYGAFMAAGNFREVIPGRIYRSGQPSLQQLPAWIRHYGLKTIVNLRGPNAPLAAEEKAVAATLGVDVVYVQLSAYRVMTAAQLVRLIDVLESAREPVLLHCRQGVDRAGTAGAIAAWLLGGQSYRQAKWQAYVPPGPWKRYGGSAHISDTLTLYETYCREQGLNPDDPCRFKFWVRKVYPNVPDGVRSGPPPK